MLRPLMISLGLLAAAGCTEPGAGALNAFASPQEADAMPIMRWSSRPEADQWTEATLAALRTHGAVLPAIEPAGIEGWCPAYAGASVEDREAFWAGLISALTKHESTYRPEAVGGGGKWFGLTQIAPATAGGYGCAARSGDALKDGSANVSCAVRIMAAKAGNGAHARGVPAIASDWGPFHVASKREDMRAWVRAQPFCQGTGRAG